MEQYWTDLDLLYKLILESDFPEISSLCKTNGLINDLCRDPTIKRIIKRKYLEYMDQRIRSKYLEFLVQHPKSYLGITEEEKIFNVMSWFGDTEAMDYLIKFRKADPHADNDYSIIVAAMGGHVNAVKLLLDLGLNPSALDNAPLEHAAKNGNIELVRFLLTYEPSLQKLDRDFDRALALAARRNYVDIVQLLSIDPNSNYGYAFTVAIDYNSIKVVKFLLETGRVNADYLNNYAIIKAASNGYNKLVQILLKYKNVDPTVDGNGPLKSAILHRHPDIVRLLLDDPRVKLSDKDHEMLKDIAVETGDRDIVELLEGERLDRGYWRLFF